MKIFNIKNKSKKTILALGAESAGNFSIFHNGKIHFSKDFGDLLDNKNYKKFQTEVLNFLKKNSPPHQLRTNKTTTKNNNWCRDK